MKSVVLATCIVLSVFLLFSCSKEPTSISGSPSAKGSAKIKLVADSGSAFGSIARSATAMVTGLGMDTLRGPLSITSNSVSGTIANIIAGPNRLFQVFVEDTGGHVCYYGQASAEVVANGTINVPMTLYRWNKGNAVIDGSIVDSLPSPECYVDTLPMPWGYPVGIKPSSVFYVRRICHGDTILDTVAYPIDTMPQYQCVTLDSTCFSTARGTFCSVKRVCHGDTILDTVFHAVDTIPTHPCAVDTLLSFPSNNDLRRTCYIRTICNGDTTLDTTISSTRPCYNPTLHPNSD